MLPDSAVSDCDWRHFKKGNHRASTKCAVLRSQFQSAQLTL